MSVYNSSFTGTQVDNAVRAVTNKAASWDAKQDAITLDSTPTPGSTNPITSGGVYTALANFSSVSYADDGDGNIAITSN